MGWLGPNLEFHLEHGIVCFEHCLAITTETLSNVNFIYLDYLFVQLEHLQIQHQTKSGPKWRAELGRSGSLAASGKNFATTAKPSIFWGRATTLEHYMQRRCGQRNPNCHVSNVTLVILIIWMVWSVSGRLCFICFVGYK